MYVYLHICIYTCIYLYMYVNLHIHLFSNQIFQVNWTTQRPQEQKELWLKVQQFVLKCSKKLNMCINILKVQPHNFEFKYKYILYSYGGMKQLYFLFANFWGYIILKKKKNHIWVNMVNDDIAREDI